VEVVKNNGPVTAMSRGQLLEKLYTACISLTETYGDGNYHTHVSRIRGIVTAIKRIEKLFVVHEWFNGFEVEYVPSGQRAWMGDGVDVLFDANEQALSPGTEGFVELWEAWLNDDPDETYEAYFGGPRGSAEVGD
jgi:hypothetical protein